MMGSGEWSVGECGIIDLDFIIPMQPETISLRRTLRGIKGKSNIATAKTVRTLLMAETIDFIASSFFLLPSSFCYVNG
jgi:hypothetical protein